VYVFTPPHLPLHSYELNYLYMQESMEIKLLLLGAGESGKTTFRKQMRIIYSPDQENQFKPEEIAQFKISIYKNIFDGMNFLIQSIATHSSEVSRFYG
jgi:GTPase SAR1 family protein